MLASSIKVARSALVRPIGLLGRHGWIARIDGGLVLKDPGRKWGLPCQELVRLADDQADKAFRRWTLPVLQALAGWELRFHELRALLPDITPRALTQTLKTLIASGWIDRSVLPSFPPTVIYSLTSAGGALCAPLNPAGR